MLKKVLLSFSLAINNIRSRLLHTFLSVLGIVIGVAALVSILSLIDGMENYANSQITNTTTLNSIIVRTETQKQVNNIWLKKENFDYLKYEDFLALQQNLNAPLKGYIQTRTSREIQIGEKEATIGANIFWMAVTIGSEGELICGNQITNLDILEKKKVAIINKSLSVIITGDSLFHHSLGKELIISDDSFKIIGVLDENTSNVSEVFIPISLLDDAELKAEPPYLIFEADNFKAVAPLKAKIEHWIDENYDKEDIKVITNEFRLKQASEGFLLFRLIMGMIVGISIIVGGIGVMNVLLISVTERTVEIGIRKAVGAKKRDILLQFLSESITIATFGSILGLLIGIASTFLFVPIIKSYASIPFQAAYTMNTLIIISIVAILVGIIFGTYPAMKAAKLDPVEAIRKE